MSHFLKCCVALLCVLVLASCQSPRTLELSIPLTHTQSVQPDTESKDVTLTVTPINPLDVMVAIETVAADNGLKPWVDPLDNDDLLGLADETASNSAVRTWHHPDYPVYLSATRHKNEILLLLNWPSEADPDPKAQKLFSAIRTQLLKEMSPFLNPATPSAQTD
jgi:hypothetical protein